MMNNSTSLEVALNRSHYYSNSTTGWQLQVRVCVCVCVCVSERERERGVGANRISYEIQQAQLGLLTIVLHGVCWYQSGGEGLSQPRLGMGMRVGV